jgi:glyceraldehyde-3-phosphate dehydrogenase/erythrose-4-phosphate dehydrogenase
MAPARVAINGCGRIGRLAFRLAWERPDALQVVALNDITAIEVRSRRAACHCTRHTAHTGRASARGAIGGSPTRDGA